MRQPRWKLIVAVTVRWTILAVIGWLLYALARALWAIIELKLPFYDWQWYLALILLLLGIAAQMAWPLPIVRLKLALGIGLLVWLIVGYNGGSNVMRLNPAAEPPVKISFWASVAFEQAPDSLFQDMQAAGGRLYLCCVGPKTFAPENRGVFLAKLARFAAHKIEVYLVPEVSDFLSVRVHEEWINTVQQVAAALQAENTTTVRGLIGDAEHPLNMPLDILELERGKFYQTQEDLRKVIQRHQQTYPHMALGVTAHWSQYLDGLDGDADLAAVQRSPVDPPGTWDFVNVMTYASYFPASWRAYHVYSIEQAMSQWYGSKSPSYSIGLVGGGFPWEPLLGFDDLVRDARLSRAVGIREVVVFQLDGALNVFGADFIRRFTAAVNSDQPDDVVAVAFSRPASMLLYGTLVADALLDVLGRGGIVLAGWALLCGVILRQGRKSGGRASRPLRVERMPARITRK